MGSGVSVVITTVNRPNELRRAIASVKRQNYEDLEIIVVVDGGNSKTLDLLKDYSEIKVISNIPAVGGAESRNIGIRATSKHLVALLDDDDEWLEEKIQIQVDSLLNFEATENIVSFTSLFTYIKNPNYLFTLPRESYSQGENVGEYLFTLKHGKWNGWIQTSTLMATRQTFLDVPFNPRLPKHQDWDWIINVHKRGIPIIHVDKPLSIYHKIKDNNSVSKNTRWDFSEQWINKQKDLISNEAYENFILAVVNNSISKDLDLSIESRSKKIFNRLKNLQIKTKISLTTGRFILQYLYNIMKYRK